MHTTHQGRTWSLWDPLLQFCAQVGVLPDGEKSGSFFLSNVVAVARAPWCAFCSLLHVYVYIPSTLITIHAQTAPLCSVDCEVLPECTNKAWVAVPCVLL